MENKTEAFGCSHDEEGKRERRRGWDDARKGRRIRGKEEKVGERQAVGRRVRG